MDRVRGSLCFVAPSLPCFKTKQNKTLDYDLEKYKAQVSCAPRSKVRTAFLLLTAALPVLSGLDRPQQRGQGKRAQSQEVVGGKERIKGLIHVAWVKGQGTWAQGNGYK